MTEKEFRKVASKVGGEDALGSMLLEIVRVWPVEFLDGLANHLSRDPSVISYLMTKCPCPADDPPNSPIYLGVRRRLRGYRVGIGVCFGGLCGEGAEFAFSWNRRLTTEGPVREWIH